MFEICFIEFFFVIPNAKLHWVCLDQTVIMIVTTVLTIGFQILLNRVFGSLLIFRFGIVNNKLFAFVENISNVFENDALRVHRSIIWIPKNFFGINNNEIFEITESNPELRINNNGTRINLERRVIIDDDFDKLSALYEKM